MTIRDTLPVDDIRPGIYIAIANEPETYREKAAEPPEFKGKPVVHQGSFAVKIVEENDNDHMRGKPILVVAYDHPFVAGITTASGNRVILDTREFKFVQVSEPFATFAVNEEMWKERYPELFDGMKIIEADSLPEGAMKVILQRGQDVMDAVGTVVEGDTTDRVNPETILSEAEDDGEPDGDANVVEV